MQPKAQWPNRIGSARKAKANEAGTSTCAETQCDRLEKTSLVTLTGPAGFYTGGFLAIDFFEQGFHRFDVENFLHLQVPLSIANNVGPSHRIGVKFERARRTIIYDRFPALIRATAFRNSSGPGTNGLATRRMGSCAPLLMADRRDRSQCSWQGQNHQGIILRMDAGPLESYLYFTSNRLVESFNGRAFGLRIVDSEGLVEVSRPDPIRRTPERVELLSAIFCVPPSDSH